MSDLTTPFATPAQALVAAVKSVGGQSAMGRLIDTTQQAVSRWLKTGRPLPAEHVLRVEQATGISRHDLRPDIYPPGGDAEAAGDETSLFGRFGGPTALADALGLSIGDVLRWRQDRRIPAEHQPAVLRLGAALHLNVTAEDVIFPFPEDRGLA